jgi:hypothetical protein
VFETSLCITSCIYAVIAFDHLALGNGRMCIARAVYALATLCVCIFHVRQHLPIDFVLIVLGIIVLACELISEWYFSGVVGKDMPTTPWLFLAPGMWLVLYRIWQYNSAYLRVGGDKNAYDSVWEKVVLSEAAALDTLRLTTNEMNRMCRSPHRQMVSETERERNEETRAFDGMDILSQGHYEQLSGSLHSPGSISKSFSSKVLLPFSAPKSAEASPKKWGALPFSISMSPGPSRLRPVTSLDQLFAQAAGMHMILRRKVQDWAYSCGGCFQLQAEWGSEFVRWADVYDKPDIVAKIKWGKLKSVSRSVEKLLGVYTEDVSRLLDICRERIVFNTVQDLLACVESISRDSFVRIVRVKNRLDPAYKSVLTAGYRYVCMYACMHERPQTYFDGWL